MAAKKHHFIPTFYQKGFVDKENLLWVYDRKLHTYKRLLPKSLCFAEDLYTVRHENIPHDRRIETDVLSRIEGYAAPIIRSLKPNVRPSPQAFTRLIHFIALQFTRLPSFGKAVRTTLEATMDQVLQMQFATPERAAHALKRIQNDGEPQSDPVSIVETIKNRRLKVTATETPFLEQMFEQANALGEWLANADWAILVAPQSTGFVICDHPFTPVPPQGTVPDGVSYGLPGAVSYFPLKRELCLELKGGDYGFQYRNVDSRAVRTINHNIAANSDRFIMGPNRSQLEAVVEKSDSRNVEPGERFSVDVIQSDDVRSLIKFTIHPGRYFY